MVNKAAPRFRSGHTDTVRGLALFPGVGFVSASHDGTARVWAVSGETLLHLAGHTALVYSAAVHPASGLIATASEDGTARVWRDGACVQTLEHPGCVWDCAFLPSGDLLTACADGVARVWTTAAERAAPAEVQEALRNIVAARAAASKTVVGVKVEDLPGVEALQESGKKEGQTLVVREGGVAVAYSWSAKEYQWEKVRPPLQALRCKGTSTNVWLAMYVRLTLTDNPCRHPREGRAQPAVGK